jgi:hypothetical protein
MTRQVYRFQGFTLIPDEEPDAEPTEFAYQCAVCNAIGPIEKDRDQIWRWTFDHLKANSEHYTYRKILILPYRMQPGDVQ